MRSTPRLETPELGAWSRARAWQGEAFESSCPNILPTHCQIKNMCLSDCVKLLRCYMSSICGGNSLTSFTGWGSFPVARRARGADQSRSLPQRVRLLALDRGARIHTNTYHNHDHNHNDNCNHYHYYYINYYHNNDNNRTVGL